MPAERTARVVFDVNVYVSALIGAGAPRRLIDLWTTTRPFELIASPMLFAELNDVLHPEKFRRWFSHEDADTLIGRLNAEAVPVKDHDLDEPVSADPDDDYLIALGRTADADAITLETAT